MAASTAGTSGAAPSPHSPAKRTRSATPSRAARARSAPASGPSPASRSQAPGSAATARTVASKRLPGTSRPTPPTTNASPGRPSSARAARRRPPSKRNADASMPLGTVWIRADGTPQARSLAATVEETATVAAPSRSVRRYSARVPRVSGRPSISSRPSECSVATEGVPASRAAVRPWTQARYRCVCTRSYPPSRTSRASRGTAARSRLPRIPRCRTRTPSARSPSATAPGLVRVTTSQRAGRWRSSSRNCRSAPPTPRPVMTWRTFTDAPLARARPGGAAGGVPPSRGGGHRGRRG
ncbi:hypothetical protein GA0115249_10953 [Streptomyces sp. PpalLS-921]|nr:hypothetical protein GA0115249_10953 [Streptomyces sp. PpalLS-921]